MCNLDDTVSKVKTRSHGVPISRVCMLSGRSHLKQIHFYRSTCLPAAKACRGDRVRVVTTDSLCRTPAGHNCAQHSLATSPEPHSAASLSGEHDDDKHRCCLFQVNV